MNTLGPGRRADGSLLLYTDDLAPVHVGDTVRYVDWDWQTHGRFYYRCGVVTEVCPGGSGVVVVHFKHYRRDQDLRVVADHLRLVSCIHQEEGQHE